MDLPLTPPSPLAARANASPDPNTDVEAGPGEETMTRHHENAGSIPSERPFPPSIPTPVMTSSQACTDAALVPPEEDSISSPTLTQPREEQVGAVGADDAPHLIHSSPSSSAVVRVKRKCERYDTQRISIEPGFDEENLDLPPLIVESDATQGDVYHVELRAEKLEHFRKHAEALRAKAAEYTTLADAWDAFPVPSKLPRELQD